MIETNNLSPDNKGRSATGFQFAVKFYGLSLGILYVSQYGPVEKTNAAAALQRH